MLSRILCGSLLFIASANANGQQENATTTSSGGVDTVEAGEVCLTQNEEPKSCSSTGQCGTSLCMLEPGSQTKKVCSCGEENEDIGGKTVSYCSCLALTAGSCEDIWRESIMCPFACEDCKTCAQKGQEECVNDDLCVYDNDTGCSLKNAECGGHADESSCNGDPDGLCKFIHPHCQANDIMNSDHVLECSAATSEADCDAKENCKHPLLQSTTDKKTNWITGGCVGLSYIEASGNCPEGFQKENDKYMDPEGHLFPVCIRPERIVTSCAYYTWDGDECKTCEDDYMLGDILEQNGKAEIHLNGICVRQDEDSNLNCYVFKNDQNQQAAHHYCERCNEGYVYEMDDDTSATTYGKCVIEPVQNSSAFPSIGFLLLIVLALGVTSFVATKLIRQILAKGQEVESNLDSVVTVQ